MKSGRSHLSFVAVGESFPYFFLIFLWGPCKTPVVGKTFFYLSVSFVGLDPQTLISYRRNWLVLVVSCCWAGTGCLKPELVVLVVDDCLTL